jgi:hypothetical protein
MTCWDAVTLACDGGPEIMGYYLILVSLLVPVDSWCDYDGDLVWCGYYEINPAWTIWGSTVDTCVDMVNLVPPLNSVWLIDVEAIDTAGNSSQSCAGPPLSAD